MASIVIADENIITKSVGDCSGCILHFFDWIFPVPYA